MAAKKKPVETLTLADLGVDTVTSDLGGSWSAVETSPRAPAAGRHHRQRRR